MLPLDEMRDAATAVVVAAWMPAGCRSAAVHVSRRRGTAVGDSDSDATADASCFFVGDAAESKDNYFGCYCARLQLQQQQQQQPQQPCPTMHAKQSLLLLLLLMLPQMMATTSSASEDEDVALCVANQLLLLPRI